MIQGLLGRLRIESIFQLEVTFLNFRFGNIFSSVTLYRYTIVYYISWVLRTMYIRISTSDRQKVLWYVIKALIWTKIGTNYWLFTLCFMFFVVKLVDWLEFSLVTISDEFQFRWSEKSVIEIRKALTYLLMFNLLNSKSSKRADTSSRMKTGLNDQELHSWLAQQWQHMDHPIKLHSNDCA